MDQEEAIKIILSGANTFLTGGAGRGKSWVIDQITDNKTVLTAPTGVAALNIGGETCHSIFALPFGMVTDEDKNKNAKKVVDLFATGAAKRLVIDEISMLRADYLDLMDYRLQRAMMNRKPFGGIQLVVVGDFYQLPPIVGRRETRHFKKLYDSAYAFDSNVWQEANFIPCILEKCYRQSETDQIALLDAIREKSKYWKHAVERLNQWCPEQEIDGQLVLCNYREDADFINKIFYDQIDAKEHVYTALVDGKFKDSDSIVDGTIKLKPGAKVVICANDPDKSYKNGQRATVKECYLDSVWVEIEDTGEIVTVLPYKWERVRYSKLMGSLTKVVEGSFKQIPLRLGWGITVHKSQGLTLERCSYNLGRQSFAAHQTYVGLSRIRNLKDLSLTRRIEEDDIIVDERVREFYQTVGG